MESAKSIDDLKKEAYAKFLETFHVEPSSAAVAPGRVNLIGEHTDYNEGFVLPMAIAHCTVAVGGPSGDSTCRIWTLAEGVDDPHYVEFPIPSKPLKRNPSYCGFLLLDVAHSVNLRVKFHAIFMSILQV